MLEIYYKNGDYDYFTPTVLPYGDGYLVANEHICFNLEKLEKEGIWWERDFFATEEEDPSLTGKQIAKFQIVTPEQLPSIRLINLAGQPYFVYDRQLDKLVCLPIEVENDLAIDPDDEVVENTDTDENENLSTLVEQEEEENTNNEEN